MTQQASYFEKTVNLAGRRLDLAVWDTAGQEKYHAIVPIYYRDSHGALLVYDITDEDSFHRVKNWVRELKKNLGDEVCIALVGNKNDCEKDRVVSHQAAEAYAKEVGAGHFLTSAKLNRGINEVFLSLCKKMVERHDMMVARRQSMPSSRSRNTLTVDESEDQTDKRSQSSCC